MKEGWAGTKQRKKSSMWQRKEQLNAAVVRKDRTAVSTYTIVIQLRLPTNYCVRSALYLDVAAVNIVIYVQQHDDVDKCWTSEISEAGIGGSGNDAGAEGVGLAIQNTVRSWHHHGKVVTC